MAIALALLAAVAYGLSDFVGGFFSQRVSPWAVALLSQFGGGLLVLTLTFVTSGSPTRTDLAWCVVAGLGNGFGTAFLYRGLASGRMGVVAPVSGVGAALLPVLAGLLGGERPAVLVWIGIALALPGIWLVSREPVDGLGAGMGAGLADGVLAGLGFGTLFAALAQVPERAGFLPLALNQLVAALTVVAIASLLRTPWLPREPLALTGLVSGALGGLAMGAFLVATHHGYLSVTAVIASLYPAFTVLLAATVLREHVHRAQAVGLGLCAVAVAMVAAG
ncbi:EamA family transporter [Nocardioides sp. LS1]|uniref:EamA family transporter n=1 Tax=Nocardioides sp. LS1 TaxID=1027620 RepID=UPI000F62757B|nr:EamA family transporter [Nocardioides sp. LS1]GCD89436.1 multidrug transporter [Nocardioides sp. LS1]